MLYEIPINKKNCRIVEYDAITTNQVQRQTKEQNKTWCNNNNPTSRQSKRWKNKRKTSPVRLLFFAAKIMHAKSGISTCTGN
jgi:hypothetical protein